VIFMLVDLDFNEEDMYLIGRAADYLSCTPEEFVLSEGKKAVRNAAYLKMIDGAYKNISEGKFHCFKDDAEIEEFINKNKNMERCFSLAGNIQINEQAVNELRSGSVL